MVYKDIFENIFITEESYHRNPSLVDGYEKVMGYLIYGGDGAAVGARVTIDTRYDIVCSIPDGKPDVPEERPLAATDHLVVVREQGTQNLFIASHHSSGYTLLTTLNGTPTGTVTKEHMHNYVVVPGELKTVSR